MNLLPVFERRWDNKSNEDKKKLINQLGLWEGFISYKYDYLPDELKQLIKEDDYK